MSVRTMVGNEVTESLNTWELDGGYLMEEIREEKTPHRAHILVIDDDPLFRARVQKIAKERDLPVTVCSSLKEVDVMATSRLFDVAIVDYYLDNLKDCLRGTDVAKVLESLPVILISQSDQCVDNNTPFPTSIRKFINKKAGVNCILDAALDMAEPPN